MDDWDADDFVPPPPILAREQPKSQWDDEDKEEETVKESWEDEEKPEPAPKLKEKESKPEKKGKKAASSPATTQQGEQQEQQQQQQDVQPLDPVAEKLRQQRLVEEADYQVTSELFGKRDEGRPLHELVPKSSKDFEEYAKLVALEIKPFESSYHYGTLLRALLKEATASMKAAEVKDLASAVTVIANEKLKAEKEATAGKKKGGAKKKQLHVDRAEEDSYTQAYDDVDDYDFM